MILQTTKDQIIAIIIDITSSHSSQVVFELFFSDTILGSHSKAFQKSFKSQEIQSKYFHSLNKIKFFSQSLFVSISGKTHSTQYQVEIFHSLSSIAIKTTTQLSLSFFHTQTSCHIWVQTLDIFSPESVFSKTTKTSVVYFWFKLDIWFSSKFLSSLFNTQAWSIT